MVSPEGACAAYYNYGRMSRHRVSETSVAVNPVPVTIQASRP